MGFELSFTFRKQTCCCMAYIDASEEPCYVFVQLKNLALVQEFGEEVTVKTDFEKRLPRKDDVGEIVHLRQALFDALKDHPEFVGAKRHFLFSAALHAKKKINGRLHQP